MDGMKVVGFFIKWLAFAIWGITVIDVIPLISEKEFTTLEIFDSINNTVTFLTAFFGFVFFLAKGLVFIFVELPHKRKKQELERDIMIEDLIKKKFDNKTDEEPTLETVKKKVNNLSYGFPVKDFALFLID